MFLTIIYKLFCEKIYPVDRKVYIGWKNCRDMQKRGQLGIIEFKYFMIGFIAGVIAATVLVFLGNNKTLPFQIPAVCGFFRSKKAQLGMIEFHYFLGGLVVGLIAGLVLIYLGNTGVIPFKLPLGCPTLGLKK